MPQTKQVFRGYFIIDTGIKFNFEINRDDADEELKDLADNNEWKYKKGDVIWLGECSMENILADRVIGFYISEYQE